MKYEVTPIVYAVHGEKQHPMFGDNVTHIEAQDDAGGLYITLTSVCPEDTSETVFGQGKVSFDVEELRVIMEVVEKMKKDWDAQEKSRSKKSTD